MLTLADGGLIYKTTSDIHTAGTAVQVQLEKKCYTGGKRQSPKSIQARRKVCGAPPNNQAVEQALPSVSFYGEVIERTSSLRYLGIHFERMLIYKVQVESTKLRCKKGVSAQKAPASKVIEQSHLFLLSFTQRH